MLHADLAALVGTTLHDRYRVDSLLGSGGMGAVFKARHVGLDRDVAIKVLHPELGRDPSIGKRFTREATSASRLDHPNCVRVSDFGTTESGTTYLVMELLTGTELDARLGEPWAPKSMIATARQILAGLEHAHHFGIVHRDLKPENVYISKDYRGEEVVKLVDFGIAKLLDEQGVEKLTRQGVVFGTPRYMSPEQAAGGKIDERTDLYAAGLIFYEMLAGRGPFDTEDTAQLLRMQIMAPPPPLPESVPASLAKVVEKLLEKSKGDRYASAHEVIAALDEVEATLAAAPVVTQPSASTSTGPRSSGAAWLPAGTPLAATSSSGHPTLGYANNYVATRTGSHLGIGQLATGQYESLVGQTVANDSLAEAVEPSGPNTSGPSRTVPVVVMEPIERHPPPAAQRRTLPWAIAGVAIMLAIVGVVVVVSLPSEEEPQTEPAKSVSAEPVGPATTPAPTSGGASEQPAPGPVRRIDARQSTSPSKSSSTTPPAKKSGGAGETKPRETEPRTEPVAPTIDDPSADEKKSNEGATITDPSGDPPSGATDPPSDASDSGGATPSGDAAEQARREAQRGKGKPKKDKGK
jgi:serine/threonine protein kinase